MAGENDRVTGEQFSAEELQRMLGLLNNELKRQNITGEICIAGGAAMILGFGSRESTRESMHCSSRRRRFAKRPNAWPMSMAGRQTGLMTGRKVLLRPGRLVREILQLSHLRVVAPPAEYILVMKCISARVGLDVHDKEDAAWLVKHLGLTNAEEVMEVVGKYYEPGRIPAKTQYFVQEVCDEFLA